MHGTCIKTLPIFFQPPPPKKKLCLPNIRLHKKLSLVILTQYPLTHLTMVRKNRTKPLVNNTSSLTIYTSWCVSNTLSPSCWFVHYVHIAKGTFLCCESLVAIPRTMTQPATFYSLLNFLHAYYLRIFLFILTPWSFLVFFYTMPRSRFFLNKSFSSQDEEMPRLFKKPEDSLRP
jgi:hypothetical protein